MGKGGYRSAYFISQFYSERMEEGNEEMLIATSLAKLWATSSLSFILLSVCPMFSIIKRVYVYNQEKSKWNILVICSLTTLLLRGNSALIIYEVEHVYVRPWRVSMH